MKRLGATRSEEEIAEQCKTYYDKTREKSGKKIQKVAREYITRKKVTATKTAGSMISNQFKEV